MDLRTGQPYWPVRPAAIASEGDAELDVYRLTHALLQGAMSSGARVYDRTNVSKASADADGVVLETNRGPRVRARQLVCAAGYQTAEYLGRRAGALHSTWAFVSEPVGPIAGWDDECLVWETSRPYVYLRRTRDGRVIMGGEDEPFKGRHKGTGTLQRKTERLVQGQPHPDADLFRFGRGRGLVRRALAALPGVG